MSYSQTESVIKNIIREIGGECAVQGETVSETLVAFMVKAVVLDPRNGFNVDRILTKNDVQKLIKLCVGRLLDKKNPSLDTIKMQVFFDMNYTNREEFLDEHHRVLESRLGTVSREITDNRARSRNELESLYRKIVSYVLLRSGLGSPTDIKVVREATAALQSVFPQTELGTFLSLNKKDKERQLKEFTMIVTGIRLFNRSCEKGGEGIDDLPAILNEAIPLTTQHLDSELQASQNQAYCYTAILEAAAENPLRIVELEPLKIKEALFNMRQYEVFLHIILADVITCAQEVEMMEKQLAAQIEYLKTVVQAKTAVPTSQVYPIFISLSSLWTSFQDEIVLLSVLSNLTTHLKPFLEAHAQLFPEEMIQGLLEGIIVKTDVERLRESLETKVNVSDFKHLDWLFPETTANFDRLLIQYRGFCAYTFATKFGLLLPGNPAIGILKYKEKYYTFSSKKSATAFAQNPDHFIELIGERAKECAELIQLLELHQQFESLIPYSKCGQRLVYQQNRLTLHHPRLPTPIPNVPKESIINSKNVLDGELVPKGSHLDKDLLLSVQTCTSDRVKSLDKRFVKPFTRCDSSSQTDTHIMQPTIVKSYEWNEWELRRKAIKLANLRQKLTHSVQTNLSHMRRDNSSQVYPLKDVGSQTKRENCSRVPKPQIYLAGLRGGMPTTHMIKVNLTRAVDET